MRWSRRPSLLLLAAAIGLGGCGGGEAARQDERWELGPSLSSRRSYVASVQVGPTIYVAGGMVGETGRPLATFQRLDTRKGSWETLSRLPAPTRAAAAAAVDGVVYVIGGTTPDGNTPGVWAWDGDGWEERAPMPAARFNHEAVALGGRVYVLGGFERGEEHDEVYAYDPARDRWELVSHLPEPNHAFGAVAFRGEIWLVGGRRGEEILDEVRIFEPDTRRWRSGPPLPEPMELLGATVAGDEIHAVWESVYQWYDASEGRWKRGPRPLVTRHALQAFAVDGVLYTVGGCTTRLRDSPVVETLRLTGGLD
jgi:hypothetical protein